jgi:hypothetical protein
VKEAAFKELVDSVQQARRIRRGTRRQSRTFTFRRTDVKAVRAKDGARETAARNGRAGVVGPLSRFCRGCSPASGRS